MRDFYILSLKWTRSGEDCATWWGPDNSGYVLSLDNAGRYSEELVRSKPGYYDNRESTLAVPCEVADRHALRLVHTDVLHSMVSEVLGVSATIVAPWQEAVDDDGKPYECPQCEHRPTSKGPSRLIVHRPKLEAVP